MPSYTFSVNGVSRTLDVPADMPLLWALRDRLGLTGTRFGCGQGVCGSCTVHLDGEAVRSCVTPMSAVAGRRVVTIEGLAPSPGELHPVQRAWLEEDVSQCGFCQPGQIMAAAAMLARTARPTDAQIDDVMRHLVCRCGTYQRIRAAVHRAAGS